jgi:hypothetical protein
VIYGACSWYHEVNEQAMAAKVKMAWNHNPKKTNTHRHLRQGEEMKCTKRCPVCILCTATSNVPWNVGNVGWTKSEDVGKLKSAE